eukprot:1090750-Heterocapsa_arctica.AAC.1
MQTISSEIMWMTWFFSKKETLKKRLSAYEDLMEAKNQLTEIGQVLNDKTEQIFVQSKTGKRIWHRTCPDYKGRVGQA